MKKKWEMKMEHFENTQNNSEMVIYTTADGLTKIETTFDGDTVWLSLDQMAELFQRDKSIISSSTLILLQECLCNPAGGYISWGIDSPTDTSLFLTTYRGGSHLPADIYS